MSTAETVENYRVYTVEGKHVIHVPFGRGEGLRAHLRAHGIEAEVIDPAATPYERVEVSGAVSAETVQALLDHWAR
jgi:transcriptional/translational regulatory protein YebC/TACO1